MFGGVLDKTVQSFHTCGEDIETLENFTYLGSVVHNDKDLDLQVADDPGLNLWL